MSLPKQPLKIDPDRQALAPYNFVELPERVAAVIEGGKLPPVPDEKNEARDNALKRRSEKVGEQLPDQDVFHADRHSGWIDCRLITASPVYVRAPRTPRQAEKRIESKDLPAFFYEWEENEPVIPGSTLRGMLRGIIEIASFGKVSNVSNRRLIYRAVGDTTKHGEKYREQLMRLESGRQSGSEKYYTPLMLGGYMRKRGSDWFIQPAQERDGTTFARIRLDERFFQRLAPVPNCNNARTVYIRVGPYDFQPVRGGFLKVRAARVLDSSDRPAPGLFAATLACSGHMFSKRSEAVIYPPDPPDQNAKGKETDKWYRLDDDQIDDYRNQISPEQEKLLGKDGVLREGQPVFYTLKGGKVDFFGHCRMLRLPYPQSPRDFVPPQIRQDRDIDFAEAIFGFTKDLDGTKHVPKERHYAGRVRIGSARLVDGQKNIWLSPNRPIVPRVLGSPKPTTFQHYLVQTQPNQFKVGQTRDGRPKYEVRLADYAAVTPASAVIRGHKLYWHKGAVAQSDMEQEGRSKDNVSTKIQPVRAGVEFKFQIQFENLSEIELGALLWVLQIGANDNYRLKLGMGKPLGLGAARTISALRLIDRTARYTKLFEEEEKLEDGEKKKIILDKWDSGFKTNEESKQVEQEAISAFERFVTKKIQPATGKIAEKITDLDRVKQLLAMLQWPGPDSSLTRYLEIERYDSEARRGKRNEYDGRPVLPHPLALPQREPDLPKPQPVSTPPPTPEQTKTDEQEAKDNKLKKGTVVVWGLGAKNNYGFIKSDEDGKDVFVHASNLKNVTSLNLDDHVQYKERKKQIGSEGFEAIEVEVLFSKGEDSDESKSD